MKRLGFDRAFLRILLIAVPFSCGPRTFYEPVPQQRCTDERIVYFDWQTLQPDGGTGADGGSAADGGTGADGGVSPGPESGSSYVLTDAQCASICSDTMLCKATVIGQVRCITQCYAFGCGRRPAELRAWNPESGDALAQYFAQAAYLEAASVQAFRRLALELEVHRAPVLLIRAAQRAVEDERRHATVMSRLARRYGGVSGLPAAGPGHVRPLAEIALENAVEGCVGETYGALVASLQTALAGDPQVRRALRRIAAEETEHARLAWSVAEWCHQRLAPAERFAVAQARLQAVAQLTREVDVEPPTALVQLAGLPTRALANRLVAQAKETLWHG